jgi:hypothetical protein
VTVRALAPAVTFVGASAEIQERHRVLPAVVDKGSPVQPEGVTPGACPYRRWRSLIVHVPFMLKLAPDSSINSTVPLMAELPLRVKIPEMK